MCGRLVASRPVEDIVEQFDVDDVRVPPELVPGPRFNVSPTDEVLAVQAVHHEGGGKPERRLGAYRWGLVPPWAKDPSIGARAFNARAETLRDKAMFRSALAKRRCIVPADGFYEWQVLASSGAPEDPPSPRRGRRGPKQPWFFRAADGRLLGFAGLYEVWRPGPESPWLASCTIVTTDANELMAPVHERMPVVLRPEVYGRWLAPGELEDDELAAILAPAPAGFLTAYRVGAAVGDSRAEGPQLVEPLVEPLESA